MNSDLITLSVPAKTRIRYDHQTNQRSCGN